MFCNDKSSIITFIFLFSLWWISSTILVGSFSLISVIAITFVVVSSVISSKIVSVLIILFVVWFLTLIAISFLFILWLLSNWLTGCVPKIFLNVFFRFREMLFFEENLFDVFAFEDLFNDFFIEWDEVFISLVS